MRSERILVAAKYPEAAAEAEELSRTARSDARIGQEGRRLAASYRSGRLDLDADEARERAVRLELQATILSRCEAEQLRALNDLFLRLGGQPHDHFVVAGDIYRVLRPGALALHCGAVLPDDDLDRQFDPLGESGGDDERQAEAGRQAEYVEMVHLPR